MTALGGFVDFGQIVFTLQAGASFRYALLWPVVLGTIAIIIYMEMCGRIAVVAREPVFAIVRDRLGKTLGLAVLLASNLLNLITCAAELGGIAIVLHLLTGWPEKMLLAAAGVALGFVVALLRFEWIERVFGLAGVTMVVAAISAWMLGPDWKALARGITPRLSMGESHQTLRLLVFRRRDLQRHAYGIRSPFLFVRRVGGGLERKGPAREFYGRKLWFGSRGGVDGGTPGNRRPGVLPAA
jgi:Mn2+/Fe2+ NRAMP family transporter